MFVDIATVVAFLLIAMVTFFVFNAIFAGRRTAAAGVESEAVLTASTPRKAGPLKRAFAYALPQPKGEINDIRSDLLRAGHYRPTALEDYLATRNVGIVLLLILFGTLAVLADPGSRAAPMLVVTGLIVAALAYGLPRLALSRQAKARVTRIERSLPDALDLVQMCLTGGLALRDALDRVAGEIQHTHPDIATELNIIRRQADAGSTQQALKNFADRIDAPDVKALSLTVMQSQRLGTDVAVAISEFADQMRLTYRQRAEERVSKIGVLVLFPVILCLVPPVLIAIAGPPLINLRNFLERENRPGGVLDPGSAVEEAQEGPNLGQQQDQ